MSRIGKSIERENRLQRVIEYYMESKKNQLENRVHRLITLNPLKTLERGYSVVTKKILKYRVNITYGII